MCAEVYRKKPQRSFVLMAFDRPHAPPRSRASAQPHHHHPQTPHPPPTHTPPGTVRFFSVIRGQKTSNSRKPPTQNRLPRCRNAHYTCTQHTREKKKFPHGGCGKRAKKVGALYLCTHRMDLVFMPAFALVSPMYIKFGSRRTRSASSGGAGTATSLKNT